MGVSVHAALWDDQENSKRDTESWVLMMSYHFLVISARKKDYRRVTNSTHVCYFHNQVSKNS